jgi:hypothetical protein
MAMPSAFLEFGINKPPQFPKEISDSWRAVLSTVLLRFKQAEY